MGDRLTEMRVFTRVARLESFSKAARELGLSTTAVSRRVAELEAGLGVKLLHRTTRRLSLTDAGRVYVDRCEALLADVDELEEQVTQQHGSPRGLLRVSAGVSFAQEQLGQLIPDLLDRYPGLSLELDLSDRMVDLVAEGIDVAVRIGRLQDSSLVARRLATSRHALVASPDYLAAHGRPGRLADLAAHAFVVDRNVSTSLRFEGPTGEARFKPEGRLRVNSASMVLEAACRGLGLALVPTFIAGAALLEGRVEAVLCDYEPEPVGIYAIYAQNRHLSTRVRVFVDFLAERLADPPPWDAWRESRRG